MYWENITACATVCSECGNLAISYLDDGGEALAALFRGRSMSPLLVQAYAAEANKQTELNREFRGDNYGENNMLWFRVCVCGVCLRKLLMEDSVACMSNQASYGEQVFGDILVSDIGSPMVEFIDFVGQAQEQWQGMIQDLAGALMDEMTPDMLKDISGEAFDVLTASDHHGIKKEKMRLFEVFSHQAVPSILQRMYAVLASGEEYRMLVLQREHNYRKIRKVAGRYPDTLRGYFEEEDLAEVKIGCFVRDEPLTFGVHIAAEIDNPNNLRFYSGLYEADMPLIKEIIQERPELFLEWDEDSVEVFRKRLVRKLQGMKL